LGEVVEFLDYLRRPITAKDRDPGPYPYYGANGQQDSVANFIFDEPLVLLAEDGGYFGDPERTIAYRVEGKCWVNNHAHVLRPKAIVDIGFLCRQLEKYDVSKFINGATRAKLNKGIASTIPIVLPPLPEQRRITAILDKADAIRRKRQEVIRLTVEFLRSVFLDMFGDPVTNPKGWEVKNLGDVVSFVSGGTPSKGNQEYWYGDFPWVSPKDMKSREMFDAIDHVAEAVFDETSLKKISPENILIVVRGMILAHTVPIAITKNSVAINQDMKALLPRRGILPDYLFWNLQTMHDYILSKVATAAHGTKRIETSVLRELPVLSPDKSLQQKFSNIAKHYSCLEKGFAECSVYSTEFFNSLVQRAFRGEL
jgi:type I restriction enzyme S subunit